MWSATSAPSLLWIRQDLCCLVIPRMRTPGTQSARRREGWSRTRRCARICRALWCMTGRRMVFSAPATIAILQANPSPVPPRGFCHGCNWNREAINYLPSAWRPYKSAPARNDPVLRYACICGCCGCAAALAADCVDGSFAQEPGIRPPVCHPSRKCNRRPRRKGLLQKNVRHPSGPAVRF